MEESLHALLEFLRPRPAFVTCRGLGCPNRSHAWHVVVLAAPCYLIVSLSISSEPVPGKSVGSLTSGELTCSKRIIDDCQLVMTIWNSATAVVRSKESRDEDQGGAGPRNTRCRGQDRVMHSSLTCCCPFSAEMALYRLDQAAPRAR